MLYSLLEYTFHVLDIPGQVLGGDRLGAVLGSPVNVQFKSFVLLILGHDKPILNLNQIQNPWENLELNPIPQKQNPSILITIKSTSKAIKSKILHLFPNLGQKLQLNP